MSGWEHSRHFDRLPATSGLPKKWALSQPVGRQQWMHFRRLGCAPALAARWQQRFPVETFRLDEKG